MNRITKVQAVPINRGQIGVEKQLPCPVCKKLVRVGGPHEGFWTFQAHSPNSDPTVMCTGANQRISTSSSG